MSRRLFMMFSLCFCIGLPSPSLSADDGASVILNLIDNPTLNSDEYETLNEYYDTQDVNKPFLDGRTPLIIATSQNNRKLVSWLIVRGADVNHITRDSATALAIAVAANNLKLAKYLISQGAEVNLQTQQSGLLQIGIDNPVLAYSLRLASAKSIRWLVEQGAQLSTDSGNENLVAATIFINKNFTAATQLVTSLTDLTQAYQGGPIDGLPQICVAATTGATPVINKYLELGGTANVACLQTSLLNMSLTPGNTDTIKVLLGAGAHISNQDKFKSISAGKELSQLIDQTIKNRKAAQISIFQAVANGDVKTLRKQQPKELNRDIGISDYARVDLITTSDLQAVGIEKTLLTLVATQRRDLMMLKTLKRLGADLTSDSYGTTPLSLAAHQQDLKIVAFLTDQGIEATAYTIENAIEQQRWPLAAYLLEHNPDIKWQDFSYPRLLEASIEAAAQSSQIEFLQAALAAGHRFNEWNTEFSSPLIPLIRTSNIEVLRLILTSLPEHQRFREFMAEVAIASNQVDVLKLLYELGMNKQNAPFLPELVNIAAATNTKALSYLLTRQRSIGAPDFIGTQALLSAAQNNNATTFEILVKGKLDFWSTDNIYQNLVLEELVNHNKLELFANLLQATRKNIAPAHSEIPSWAARKTSPEWMQLVYTNRLFAAAISQQKPELAKTVAIGMRDKSDEEIQLRAQLFGPSDSHLIGAMLNQLTEIQLSHYFSSDKPELLRVLKPHCQQAANSKAQNNCQMLEGLLDETSLAALVLAIQQNRTSTIEDWFSNTDKDDWPTIDTPVARDKSLGDIFIEQDEVTSFFNIYGPDIYLPWTLLRLIAEENAQNIFTRLLKLTPARLDDITTILDRATELGNQEFVRAALQADLKVNWQHMAEVATRSDQIEILQQLALLQTIDKPELLIIAVEYAAEDSVDFLLFTLASNQAQLSNLLEKAVVQLHHFKVIGDLKYRQQLGICRRLLEAGAAVSHVKQNSRSILSYALEHRLLGFLSHLDGQFFLDTPDATLLTTFIRATHLHDIVWLNALTRHVSTWPAESIHNARYLAAGDPALNQFIENLALQQKVQIDGSAQPSNRQNNLENNQQKHQSLTPVLLERFPAFEAIGHIQQLQSGTLLVSGSTVEIVSGAKTLRRLTSIEHIINPSLTLVDESRSTLFLAGGNTQKPELSAWNFATNEVVWRQSMFESIENIWLDSKSNILHLVLHPEYGEGTSHYEQRNGTTGELIEQADLNLLAASMNISIDNSSPQLVPNSTRVIFLNEKTYPKVGTRLQMIDLQTHAMELKIDTELSVHRVVLNDDYAALEGLSNRIEIWNLTRGLKTHTLDLTSGYHSIQFFRFPHLVIANDQQGMSHHNLETSERHLVTQPSGENFHAASFKNQQLLGASYQTKELYLFGQPTPKADGQIPLEATLVSADESPYVHRILTNGKNLAVIDSRVDGQKDQSRLWQLDRGRSIRLLAGGSPIALSSDNRRLLGRLDGDQISLVNLHTGKNIQQIRSSEHLPLLPAFSSDGREVWFLQDSNTLAVINTWSDRVVASMPLLLPIDSEHWQPSAFSSSSKKSQTCHLLLPDRAMLALCSQNSQLLFSDVTTGNVISVVQLDNPAQNVYPLEPGGFFILDQENQGYWVSNELQLESKVVIPEGKFGLAVHGPGQQIALVSREAGLILLDKYGAPVLRQTRDQLSIEHPLNPDHVAFVQDGNALLLAGPNGSRIIPLTPESEPRELTAISSRIRDFEIDGAQSLLNMEIEGGSNIVWDLATGAEIKRFDQNSLSIGPNRSLHGVKQDFSGATNRFDLNSNTWHESVSRPYEKNPLGLAPLDIETAVLHRRLSANGESTQLLLKTSQALQWITKNTQSGQVISRLELPDLLPFVADAIFTPVTALFENHLALFSNQTLLLVDLNDGEILWRKTIPDHLEGNHPFSGLEMTFINHGRFISLPVSSQAKDIQSGQLIINAQTGEFQLAFVNNNYINSFDDNPQWLFLPHPEQALALKLYPNGNLELVDGITATPLKTMQGHFKKPQSAYLLDQGRRMITSSENKTLMWRLDVEGTPIELDIGPLQKATMSGGYLWLLSKTGSLEVFHSNGNRLANLVSMANGSWLVTAEDGRYDSNTPGNLKGIGWVVSDNPLDVLPIEVFMKQYYEPRLLPRILGRGTFVSIANLASINRNQPSVSIENIVRQSDRTVSVTIDLSLVTQDRDLETGANQILDLRLLRDGKQIAHFPEDHGSITLEADGSATITFEQIPLPQRLKGEFVTFEAMAFNSSGIKSPTAKHLYQVENNVHYEQRRAFVINVGVNHYSHPRWNLAYAVNDATAINRSLTAKLAANFDEVISIPILTTEDSWVTEADISNTLTQIFSGSDAHNPLTPNDSVFFTWAGHGIATDDGEFHLITSDVGNSGQVDKDFLQHSVSTSDLTRWFEPLDADNIIMVIDACNSAASVEGGDFKPGPMGSRGFGQLAWFKGMQIITASQSDDVALESATIKHGLLTYSMVVEGLDLAAADTKPVNASISTSEWLEYGQQRVPQLFVALKSGNLADEVLDKRGLTPPTIEPAKIEPQTPALFNFKKNDKELEMSVN